MCVRLRMPVALEGYMFLDILGQRWMKSTSLEMPADVSDFVCCQEERQACSSSDRIARDILHPRSGPLFSGVRVQNKLFRWLTRCCILVVVATIERVGNVCLENRLTESSSQPRLRMENSVQSGDPSGNHFAS